MGEVNKQRICANVYVDVERRDQSCVARLLRPTGAKTGASYCEGFNAVGVRYNEMILREAHVL